jgi:biofilm PGA synthesis N-glycosyltransferase PgaC
VSRLRYGVVTPARNESRNLPRLMESLRRQTLGPTAWLIVDDGSDDGGRELAEAYAREHTWIHVVDSRAGRQGDLTQGRREGRDLLAFRLGIASLPVPVDVVSKVDADLSFDPDFFDGLVARFEADPTLGIAGGRCLEVEDGMWVPRKVMSGAVRGATRAYRWECVAALEAVEPKMGWDGIDEVVVELDGWHTRSFNDLPFRHHRAVGARERGRLHARSVQGRASWYMGYRPTYLALRALYRALEEPAHLAMLWGYAVAALGRAPRCADDRVVTRIRDRQRLRSLRARGLPR